MKANTESSGKQQSMGQAMTRESSVVALQMKDNVSSFKALWTVNQPNSVTIRCRGKRVKTSKSGI